ncbi:hypothetical protein [Parafrankia discariae]|uniref:hypothetical protein n=1 Tax=Parafrankia discariae TaxID=365528 RepID=UPI0003A4F1C5|nr:hypothetical protein [Parafrankia discariae]
MIGDEGVEVQCDRGTLPAELADALDRCGAGTTLVGIARGGNAISVSITVAPENAAADGGFCTRGLSDVIRVRAGTPTALLTAALRRVPAGRVISDVTPGPGLLGICVALEHTLRA